MVLERLPRLIARRPRRKVSKVGRPPKTVKVKGGDDTQLIIGECL